MKKFLLENGRPDKPVPCPRCHSLNTKFCYFNNYNVKQPRHFCRECQRYWTAGGSLRNVPIGAGRRKHKIGSMVSSKLHGSPKATKDACSDVGGEYACISSTKPCPSLSFEQLIAQNRNGNVSQQVHNLMGIQCDDAMSECGSAKPWFQQVLQKPAKDVSVNSNVSVVTQGHGSSTTTMPSTRGDNHSFQQPEFSESLQKHLTNMGVKRKAANAHGTDTSTRVCECDDMVRDCAFDVMHEDAHGKGKPELRPSDVSSGNQWLPPSDSARSCEQLESICMTEDGDTCSAPLKASLSSSASEAAIYPTVSDPMVHNSSLESKPLRLDSVPALWGPFMWPWMWPFCVNGANTAQVDPNLSAGIGALAASLASCTDHATGAVSVKDTSHIDMTGTSVLGASPNFPQWPYVWNPFAWVSPWNAAWNVIHPGHEQLSRGQAKEKQGLLCIPKTLRMDRPDEAAHSSILRTLGVTAASQSPASFLNTFQPKADVFQAKMVPPKTVERSEFHHHTLPHLNPAAQARSVAFQEGN